MGFFDTLGKIVDPVGIVSGFTSGKGALGGVGETLYGNAGANEYQPEPFRFGSFKYTPAEELQKNFQARDTGRDIALMEMAGNQARRMQAPQAQAPGGPIQTTGFTPAQYGGARINTSGYNSQLGTFGAQRAQANAARAQQASDLGLLRSAALGEQPSVAEMQMREGVDRNIAAQASLAASARGGAGARLAAQRQAAIQGAAAMNAANREAAQLRAGEMAQARGQLMAGGEALRAGDINQQGIQLNAAGLALQPSIQQAQLEQEARMQGVGLGAQAGMQTQGIQAQAALQNQQLGTQINLANLGAQLQNTQLANQYGLGLLGNMTAQDQLALQGNMALAGFTNAQEFQDRQQRIQELQARQQLEAGIASGNAQTGLVRSSGGLGFLGGGMGAIASMV